MGGGDGPNNDTDINKCKSDEIKSKLRKLIITSTG
jgi:hypothetical protein